MEPRDEGVVRAREGACLGNRCNYSARCVRSGVGEGGLSVLMLVSPYTTWHHTGSRLHTERRPKSTGEYISYEGGHE